MASLVDAFRNHARRQPDKQAIWCDGKSMTYGELADFVGRWSAAMDDRGVARGDAIAVLLPNSIEFVALMLVAADLDAVLVPLSTSLPPAAVYRAFEASDVRHVVGTTHTLEDLRSEGDSGHTPATGLWLRVDGALPGVEGLRGLLAGSRARRAGGREVGDRDPYILTLTSGSTGDPKPIVLTQRTKVNRVAAAVELYGITGADRTLAATPLYHSLAERLVLIPLLTGGTSVLMRRFSPSEWLRCVAEQSVTFTIAVSSQLAQIAECLREAGQSALDSLRCVVSSSALLEAGVKADLLDRLACAFHECYGASEVAIVTNLDPADARRKLHSVGKAAPGVDLRILGADDRVVPVGEPGEIVCRTPMAFGGYYKRPDLTRQAMWGEHFRTGDMGRLDEEGFLYFLGRKKDIIITGGINVYPADVEGVIQGHPDVRECAAFALPDTRLGEVVAVAVVPMNPSAFHPRALRFLCARELADFQQPRRIFAVDHLPRNSLGKVMKRALPEYCARASQGKD
ncbi:MAG: acyl--CoA ligase [Lentisphaeria bacterium]|nr:acyl--CoA ligase [Lentisphaeria bacterium]